MNLLLVEDNNADALLLKDFLVCDQFRPRVYWVKDGQVALDFLGKKGDFADSPVPDIILLDLALPYLSGFDVLKQMRREPAYSHIPVVVLTTSSNPKDRENCLEMGASAFFSKPFTLKGYETLVETFVMSEFPRLTEGRLQSRLS